jgi:hypothetical protein
MKHKHKRMDGVQYCACGRYMGIPRKYISIKEIIPVTKGGAYVMEKRQLFYETNKGWKPLL